uniref:Uncharacterized protein n=1 Tax=Arundo donax TaxID=35708 RepID=A0A0A8XRG1_ARUDO
MGSVSLKKWETNLRWGGQLHSLFVYIVPLTFFKCTHS